jgi:Zn-dependent peptidase ImmA (M78 family)
MEDYSLDDSVILKWSQKRFERHADAACEPDINTVHVIAGTDKEDARLALCHEMAHLIRKADGHTHQFWQTYIEMVRRYRLSMRQWLEAEGDRLYAYDAYKRVGGKL